jgi:effector-binding domain-containing protein
MDNVLEHTIISLPKTMPLDQRITEVTKQLSEWLKSLDKLPKDSASKVFLTKFENGEEDYRYHYSIIMSDN